MVGPEKVKADGVEAVGLDLLEDILVTVVRRGSRQPRMSWVSYKPKLGDWQPLAVKLGRAVTQRVNVGSSPTEMDATDLMKVLVPLMTRLYLSHVTRLVRLSEVAAAQESHPKTAATNR